MIKKSMFKGFLKRIIVEAIKELISPELTAIRGDAEMPKRKACV